MKYQIKANTKLEQFELESRLTWQDENSLPIWLEQFSMSASGLRQLSQKCDGEGSADWLQRAPCNCMPKVNNCVGFGKSKYGKSKQYPDNVCILYMLYLATVRLLSMHKLVKLGKLKLLLMDVECVVLKDFPSQRRS